MQAALRMVADEMKDEAVFVELRTDHANRDDEEEYKRRPSYASS
ncbi:hypothetical protein [Sphingomonas sp. OK281]|nr:hypothetical protein [Sphingomonas sp. OK281]SFO17702.1 hypothetical protein SAMN05428984_2531 [Sphingomonas sp. OK281]